MMNPCMSLIHQIKHMAVDTPTQIFAQIILLRTYAHSRRMTMYASVPLERGKRAIFDSIQNEQTIL